MMPRIDTHQADALNLSYLRHPSQVRLRKVNTRRDMKGFIANTYRPNVMPGGLECRRWYDRYRFIDGSEQTARKCAPQSQRCLRVLRNQSRTLFLELSR